MHTTTTTPTFAFVKSMLAFLCAVTIVEFATISSAQSSPPCKVKFGQSASFTGTAWTPAGAYNVGLLAAFHEVNTKHGGVKGCELELISKDDQYVPSKTVENVEEILKDHPDIVAFLSLMGSPTTAIALPIAAAAGKPIIGPLTGSSVFRKTFNPWTINVRSGYDDEALAMLQLLLTEKKYKRISMIYQDDAFGAPAMIAIEEAMAGMKLQLVSKHPYTSAAARNGEYDYSQWAANVWEKKPQAVILFATGAFSNPFLEKFYTLEPQQTAKVSMVIGSWMGDSHMAVLKTMKVDPTNFYTTQVFPHPMDAKSNLSSHYRQAVKEYVAATSPTSTPTYDYLGIEGYVSAQMAIEALRRSEQPFNSERLLTAVYGTKMFSFDEILAGPFSRDCIHDPGTAQGRSAFCECNQGLRFVGTTVFSKDFDFVPVGETLNYPTTECFATTSLLNRPLVFGGMYKNTSSMMASSAGLLQKGVALEKSISGSMALLPLQEQSSNEELSLRTREDSQSALSQLDSFGEDSLVVAGVAALPLVTPSKEQNINETFNFPVFPGMFGPAHLANEIFNEKAIYVSVTLQQEIFATVAYLRDVKTKLEASQSSESFADKIVLIQSLPLSTERNDVGRSVYSALSDSLTSNNFGENGASIDAEVVFDPADYRTSSSTDPAAVAEAASKFAALLETVFDNVDGTSLPAHAHVNILLYGLDVEHKDSVLVHGLATFLGTRARAAGGPKLRIFLSFTELAAVFHHVQEDYCFFNQSIDMVECPPNVMAGLELLHFASNLPVWSANFLEIHEAIESGASVAAYTGTFAYDFQRAIIASPSENDDHARHVYNPLVATGFWLSKVAQFVLLRTRGDASPEAFTEELYHSSVIVIDGVVMGPFVNKQCAGSDDCLCNFGARTLDIHTVANIFQAANESLGESHPVYEHRFQHCHVRYTFPVWSLSTAQLAGIIVGSVVVVFLIALTPSAHTKYKAMRRVAAAPKDPSQPYTLVFTDIQNSTSLWARIPEEMGGALDAHHDIIRDLIDKHNGYEVKTIGDAFMIAFKSPDDAVDLCIGLQREFYRYDWANNAHAPSIDEAYKLFEAEAIEEEGTGTHRAPTVNMPETLYKKHWNGLRVRCGIHTGIGDIKFEEVVNGYDYYGNVPNVAARTEAVANGGQVCLTRFAVDALKRCANVKMTNLGGVELRGVPEPVEIFQLDELKLSGGEEIAMREYPPLRLEKALEIREDESEITGNDTMSETDTANHSFSQHSSLHPGLMGGYNNLNSPSGENNSRVSGPSESGSLGLSTSGENCNFKEAVTTLFSTMDVDSRLSMLKKIAGKWRLKLSNKKKVVVSTGGGPNNNVNTNGSAKNAGGSGKNGSDVLSCKSDQAGNSAAASPPKLKTREQQKKEDIDDLIALLNRKLLGVFKSKKKNRGGGPRASLANGQQLEQSFLSQLRGQEPSPEQLEALRRKMSANSMTLANRAKSPMMIPPPLNAIGTNGAGGMPGAVPGPGQSLEQTLDDDGPPDSNTSFGRTPTKVGMPQRRATTAGITEDDLVNSGNSGHLRRQGSNNAGRQTPPTPSMHLKKRSSSLSASPKPPLGSISPSQVGNGSFGRPLNAPIAANMEQLGQQVTSQSSTTFVQMATGSINQEQFATGDYLSQTTGSNSEGPQQHGGHIPAHPPEEDGDGDVHDEEAATTVAVVDGHESSQKYRIEDDAGQQQQQPQSQK